MLIQNKVNLLNFDRETLRNYFLELNEKSFRADQLLKWIHQYGETDFSKMTNFSKSLRQQLTDQMIISAPEIVKEQKSSDGTIKWLMQLADELCVETVFIPEKDRGTLCVSSQVGCPIGCSFCATGKMGFKRNLETSEIIGQLWLITRKISELKKITNVVLMGMGEPLLNFENVLRAVNLMMDDLTYNLSKYRVTLSTVGMIPEMKRLSELSEVSLAISLHAPNDTLRNQLIPINKKYSLKSLIAACKTFFNKNSKRKVSIEYVMLKNVNDRLEHAKELIRLLVNVPCKVNLIPFNSVKNIPYESSDDETIHRFQDTLMHAGIRTITRRRRGVDIQAACGQLSQMGL